MIPLWVVMWVPVAVTGTFGVVMLGAWLFGVGRGGEDDADGESDGGGGGGGGRRRPRPPQPPPGSGPVDWPEFERQFAEFVARRPRPPAVSRERRSEEVGTGSGRGG